MSIARHQKSVMVANGWEFTTNRIQIVNKATGRLKFVESTRWKHATLSPISVTFTQAKKIAFPALQQLKLF